MRKGIRCIDLWEFI